MHLSLVQWLPILGTLALQGAILTVMVRRKFRSVFPYFFSFVVFSLLAYLLQAVLLPVSTSVTYFYEYWCTTAIQTVMTFAVLYEVFIHVLKPYSALVDLGTLLFKWAFCFLALASVVTAFATNGSQLVRICATIQVLDRSCKLMQCGLLLLFVLFESRLRVSWRSPAVCIMLGFGSQAALALTKSFLRDHFPDQAVAFGWIVPIACVVAHGCWLASFALPQPARTTVQDSPTRLILQRWNEALMASPLIARTGDVAVMSPVESFLPGVERTVERVMARKMMH